jgi:argininosuccinate lyase
MVSTLAFRTDRMAAAADNPYAAAIDLAEYLVAAGTPFRDAHAVVGALVRAALAGEGSLVDLVSADERLGPEAAALLAPGAPVRRRTTPGGAGPGPVAVQRGRFVNRLAAQAKRIAD